MGTEHQEAKEGDAVTIEFVGRNTSSKEEVLSSKDSGPFQFVIGDETTFKKINDAVVGMKVSELKQVSLKPADAYGDRDDSLVFEVPKEKLPENLEIGAVLNSPEDEESGEWTVTKMEDDIITLDGNHPLAGVSLTFEIELVAIGD